MSNACDIFCIYSENDTGTLDELLVDMFNEEYAYKGNVEEKELRCRQDNRIKGFKTERKFFQYYFGLIEKNYSGSFEINENDYAARKKIAEAEAEEEKAKPLIRRETVRKALRLELSETELNKAASFDYRLPKDDYYDFDLFMEKIYDVMEGRLEVDTFTLWCVIVMRCLEDCMDTRSAKLKSLYYDLGDCFDGMAFMSRDISEKEKRKDCLESIALLKYYNHRIHDAKARSVTPFETNGVITYVTFCCSLNDGAECLLKACVVDLHKEKINYMFVRECEYDPRINYTFLSDQDFEALPSEYFVGYALDEWMTIHYAREKSKV